MGLFRGRTGHPLNIHFTGQSMPGVLTFRPLFTGAHPPALVSFSLAHKVPDTRIIPQVWHICGPVGYAPYALPGSEQLGNAIADAFAGGYNAVLLENHGIVTGGPDLLVAFQRLETLDFCARTLLKAHMLGKVYTLDEAQQALFDDRQYFLPEFTPGDPGSHERALRQQIIEIVHRVCDRQLAISTEGVVSARIDDSRFLITPTGLDRRALGIEDVVLIHNGRHEKGKLPSRSVLLHQAVYKLHPEIGCIIVAQPPNIMAYAITHTPFDTRTIPECYILLRDLSIIPYGIQHTDPEQIASAISSSAPVLLIQNDCVLTVGRNVLEAFDRLEVAEYSAHSLIGTTSIGALVPMGEQEIRDLQAAFPLP